MFLVAPAASANEEIRCETPILSMADIVSESQPLIRWRPVANATRYRLQLDSRVPEGQRITAIDTYLESAEFKPPQRLTDHRARVTVTVTAWCGKDVGKQSMPLRFEIDTALACGSVANPMRLKNGTVKWRGVADAVVYRVAMFDGASGDLINQADIAGDQFSLPAKLKTTALVSVRPRCKNGWGNAVYLALPESDGAGGR